MELVKQLTDNYKNMVNCRVAKTSALCSENTIINEQINAIAKKYLTTITQKEVGFGLG